MAFPGYDGLCPRVTFDPIASKKEISPQDLAALKNAGLVVADKPIREDLRRRYTLPPMEPWESFVERNPNAGRKSPDELAKLVEVALSLKEQGVELDKALEAVGLNPTAVETEHDGSSDSTTSIEVKNVDDMLRSWNRERCRRGPVR